MREGVCVKDSPVLSVVGGRSEEIRSGRRVRGCWDCGLRVKGVSE